ncbi:MAG: metal-dependent hydrolase [Trueperaceae bacterium]|nr:metal-dependent hydrolase [Trueperaceae bacterium]
MELTFMGHSAVRLRTADHEVIVDPYLSGNPMAVQGPDDVDPGHVILTHAHGDHLGDTVEIAKRTGATVIASVEIVDHLAEQGVSGSGMNVGGSVEFDFGRVTFTPAWHSNSFPDGTYGGMPMGVIVEIGGVRVYHAGDTALFSDMALVGRRGIDVALLPIGDTFTMGPDDALEAVRLIAPRAVIPIHYGTFPAIEQDAEAFARAVQAAGDVDCHPLRPGQSLDL